MPKGYGWLRSPKKYGYNKVSLNGLRSCLEVRFFVWIGLFNWRICYKIPVVNDLRKEVNSDGLQFF